MRYFIAALACLCLVGCPGETDDDLRTGRNSSGIEVQGDAKPSVTNGAIDVGNGVYYFASNRADFARSLSEFIAAHPDLEIVTMAGDGTDGHGYDRGYFVVFRQR